MRVYRMCCRAHAGARGVVRVARLSVAGTRRDTDDGAALRECRAPAVARACRFTDHELVVAVAIRRMIRIHRGTDADERDVRTDLARLRQAAGLVDAPPDGGDLLVDLRSAEADRRDWRGELLVEHDEGRVAIAHVRRCLDDHLRPARAAVRLDFRIGGDAAFAEEDDEALRIAVGLHGAAGDRRPLLRACGRRVGVGDAMARRDDQVRCDERGRTETPPMAVLERRQHDHGVMLRTRGDAPDDGLDRLAHGLWRLVRLSTIRTPQDDYRQSG